MGRDPKNPIFQFVPISGSVEIGQVLVLELMSLVYINTRKVDRKTQKKYSTNYYDYLPPPILI